VVGGLVVVAIPLPKSCGGVFEVHENCPSADGPSVEVLADGQSHAHFSHVSLPDLKRGNISDISRCQSYIVMGSLIMSALECQCSVCT